MQFPITIHKVEGNVYGITVPDIPGVHSWGDMRAASSGMSPYISNSRTAKQ
jgi:hypothetical protein